MNHLIKSLVEQEVDISNLHEDDVSASFQKARMLVECGTDGHIENKDQKIAANMISILKKEYNAPERI